MTSAARPTDWRHHVTVIDMVAELTRPHRHREHYTSALRPGGYRLSQGHTTRVPSLLDQLDQAPPASQGGGRSGAYESRPAARLEALDALVTIDTDAARWVRMLGEDDPGDTVRCVVLVGALLGRARRCDLVKPKPDCCPSHTIEHDVRRWWSHARVVTGWDEPPFRPDVTCPACARRGGLRVRLEERVGFCAECHAFWDPSGYQQLADHVRVESAERTARAAEPCWCPWPTPVERIGALCPKCASGRCHRAVTANATRSAAS